jgi:hypothetical protein
MSHPTIRVSGYTLGRQLISLVDGGSAAAENPQAGTLSSFARPDLTWPTTN